MKKILVDFPSLGTFCGLAEVERNFAEELAKLTFDDMRFVFLVHKDWIGKFGNKVDYLDNNRNTYRKEVKLLSEIDLWHSTNQFRRSHAVSKRTVNLLTIHDLNFMHELPFWERTNGLLKLAGKVRRADHVTVISQFVESEVRHYLKWVHRPITTIENAVRDMSTDGQERPKFVDGVPFFFTIGQVRHKKNFRLLVEMMTYFPDRQLYVCGDDSFPYADELRQLIAEKSITNAHICGKISQAEKGWLYAHCEAFLFPSLLEGFGLPVVEAMQFGRAVFASNCTSLPEVCGDSAFMWPDLQPEAMARMIKEKLPNFYDNKKRIAEIISYAQSYNYQDYTQKYIRLYRQLVGLD